MQGFEKDFNMIDYRLVYILKYRSRYKIGIAKDIDTRLSNIKRTSGENRIRVYTKIKTPFAYKIEQWLHEKFEHRQREFKGSGKTEWFDLGIVDRAKILLLFNFIEFAKIIFVLAVIWGWVFLGYLMIT